MTAGEPTCWDLGPAFMAMTHIKTMVAHGVKPRKGEAFAETKVIDFATGNSTLNHVATWDIGVSQPAFLDIGILRRHLVSRLASITGSTQAFWVCDHKGSTAKNLRQWQGRCPWLSQASRAMPFGFVHSHGGNPQPSLNDHLWWNQPPSWGYIIHGESHLYPFVVYPKLHLHGYPLCLQRILLHKRMKQVYPKVSKNRDIQTLSPPKPNTPRNLGWVLL